MNGRRFLAAVFGLAAILGNATLPGAHVDGDLARQASWSQPTAEAVWGLLEQYLAGRGADDEQRKQVAAAWRSDVATDDAEFLLDRTAAALAVLEPRAAGVLAACRTDPAALPVDFAWLRDPATPELVRNNLRLLYGRWLAQHAYFDESLEYLAGIQPHEVVDPASLLFYQAVSQHRLLRKDECLKSLAKLLENEQRLPRRYKSLAQLMQTDIKPLKPDSLDEISRLMDDIRRRLDFGHAGKRVRQQEEDVIAKLDKLIDELEQQQQQQQQGAGAGAGNIQSSSPAPDSANLGGRGAGDVDPRKIGHKAGWGDLPPKEREEALQQISKDLPAHFREVIEEYFRKLAREESE